MSKHNRGLGQGLDHCDEVQLASSNTHGVVRAAAPPATVDRHDCEAADQMRLEEAEAAAASSRPVHENDWRAGADDPAPKLDLLYRQRQLRTSSYSCVHAPGARSRRSATKMRR